MASSVSSQVFGESPIIDVINAQLPPERQIVAPEGLHLEPYSPFPGVFERKAPEYVNPLGKLVYAPQEAFKLALVPYREGENWYVPIKNSHFYVISGRGSKRYGRLLGHSTQAFYLPLKDYPIDVPFDVEERHWSDTSSEAMGDLYIIYDRETKSASYRAIFYDPVYYNGSHRFKTIEPMYDGKVVRQGACYSEDEFIITVPHPVTSDLYHENYRHFYRDDEGKIASYRRRCLGRVHDDYFVADETPYTWKVKPYPGRKVEETKYNGDMKEPVPCSVEQAYSLLQVKNLLSKEKKTYLVKNHGFDLPCHDPFLVNGRLFYRSYRSPEDPFNLQRTYFQSLCDGNTIIIDACSMQPVKEVFL